MHGQPHLTRRGDVYQWRRKIGRFSTRIVQLRLSLGTTNRRLAIILARRATAASEAIVTELLEDRMTESEARLWLADVVRKTRDAIETRQLLGRLDGGDPASDHAQDEAFRAAWTFIAKEGLAAPYPTGTPQDHAGQLFFDAITVLTADLQGEARRARIRAEFCRLTGRSDLQGLDFLQVLDLYIQAKAAAWNAPRDGGESVTTMATDIARLPHSAFVVSLTEGKETSAAIDHSSANPLHGPVPGPVFTSSRPAAGDAPDGRITPIQQSADTPAPEPEFDPHIRAVVARMNEVGRTEGVDEKTLRQYQSFADLFTLITGVSDVRAIRQSHAAAFVSMLAKIPKSWGKSPADCHATREQMLTKAQALPPEKVGLAPGTINRHLDHLAALLQHADSEGLEIDQRVKTTKLRRKQTIRDRDKRRAFKEDELRQLFAAPVWTGCRSPRKRTTAGPHVFKNGFYWAPLLIAYSGARREEIAGLAVEDIREIDGVYCLVIEDNDFRGVKNLPSRRVVPLHSRLPELGFLDYLAEMKEKGSPDLFPDLLEPSATKRGKKLGRGMRLIIDEALGTSGKDLCLHAMRHYVKSALQKYPDLRGNIVRDIMGHEAQDTHDRVYGERTAVAIMKEAIDRLPVVF